MLGWDEFLLYIYMLALYVYILVLFTGYIFHSSYIILWVWPASQDAIMAAMKVSIGIDKHPGGHWHHGGHTQDILHFHPHL